MNYGHCNCNLTKKKKLVQKECGCGEEHINPMRDTIIHWNGQHWMLECAFARALELIELADISTNED